MGAWSDQTESGRGLMMAHPDWVALKGAWPAWWEGLIKRASFRWWAGLYVGEWPEGVV